MDLPTVKAAVKTWEKTFKAKHGREPTKEDIKRDPSGIVEQYALYRKLSKTAGPSSQSQSQSHLQSQAQSQAQSQSQAQASRHLHPPSSSASGSTTLSHGSRRSSSSTSTSEAGSKITPRTAPVKEYPTTPTPPSRRSTPSTSRAPIQPVFGSGSGSGDAAPGPSRALQSATTSLLGSNTPKSSGKSLKRTASRAALTHNEPEPEPSSPPNPPSARSSFITPKKARPYSGPIHDPNPVNPFAASPLRAASSLFGVGSSTGTSTQNPAAPGPSRDQDRNRDRGQDRVRDRAPTPNLSSNVDSPFIHANSPRKLREVLEANSLRKVKERMESPAKSEITPRTRARKRLRGEVVDDTPMKDRVPRRKRGERNREEGTGANGTMPSKSGGSTRLAETGLDRLGKPVHDSDDEMDGNAQEADGTDDEGEDDDDELGPSPFRQPNGRTFTALLAEQADEDEDGQGAALRDGGYVGREDARARAKAMGPGLTGKSTGVVKRGRPSEMMGLFGRVAKANGKGKATSKSDSLLDAAPTVPVSPLDREASTEVTVTGAPSLLDGHNQTARPGDGSAPAEIMSGIVVDEHDNSDVAAEEAHRLSTPPPDPLLEAALSQPTPSRLARRDKVLTIEEDEADEWDPEGGNVRREVVIVPTRRAVSRQVESDELGSDVEVSDAPDEEGDEDEDEVDEGDQRGTDTAKSSDAVEAENRREGNPVYDDEMSDHPGPGSRSSKDNDGTALTATTTTTLSSAVPSSPAASAPPLFSMLSLHSPSARRVRTQKTSRAEELRVKAIFDPLAAAQLRAIRRGQDVFVAGEGADGDEEEEDEIMQRYNLRLGAHEEEAEAEVQDGGEDVFEDDDWEEEDEGWKRTVMGMDDDEPW